MKKFLVNLTPLAKDLAAENTIMTGSVLSYHGQTYYLMLTDNKALYRETMGADAVPVISPNTIEARKDAKPGSDTDSNADS